jgi:poly(3-hydroxybutyrate) depolymerase
MYFHGQDGQWPVSYTNYHVLGEREGFISVYPRGYGDYGGIDDDWYIAWNVGLMDDGMEAADDTCFEGTHSDCFDSCNQECSRCAWSTCVDDVKFIVKLLDELKERYNIDDRAIFVTGASNGGMMTHYFTAKQPEIARAIVPMQGLPLWSMTDVPHSLSNVPIM